MKLVIGNQNYSSWSLRPWLLLKHFSVPFDEFKVSLKQQNLSAFLGQFSPSCKVPVLVDGQLTIWDSLAICEYVNEQYLNGQAWPDSPVLRARARAVVCEMHSGLSALRNEMPMNCRAQRRVTLSEAARKDVARVDNILAQAADEQKGVDGYWLFGRFGIADCFFAPVSLRLKTYGINLSEPAAAYCDRLLQHNGMRQWYAAALEETEVLDFDEAGDPIEPAA